ncbi:hypothetical protein D3C76_1021570 [compost metagenome]
MGHLDFNQYLGPVRGWEELLLHSPHAQNRHDEARHDQRGHTPLALDHQAQQLAEPIVVPGVVDRLMPAFHCPDVRQQFHAEVWRENDGHKP